MATGVRCQRRHAHGSEQGFTVLELIVVLLIMAVLLAIAIPTFLSNTADAEDRSIQANLADALVEVVNTYTSSGTYPDVSALVSVMNADEPNLSFTKGVSKSDDTISLNVSSSGLQVVMVGRSGSGRCWAISENDGDPTDAAWGAAPVGTSYVAWDATVKGAKACNAKNAFGASEGMALSGAPWSDAFPATAESGKP